jgi:hypothetical protein
VPPEDSCSIDNHRAANNDDGNGDNDDDDDDDDSPSPGELRCE